MLSASSFGLAGYLLHGAQRRSGIEGALPFRGGAGDNIEVRLAGTPAGRFAAITEPLIASERLLVEAEGWRALFLQSFLQKA